MFESTESDSTPPSPRQSAGPVSRRSCWVESTLLTNLIKSLPSLNHISFFADASDDSTLALLFSSLITHPSSHSVPPPTCPSSPSNRSSSSGYIPSENTVQPVPFASRIHSFGWRQRASPPQGTQAFSQASTFVSTLHLIRHAHRLGFLVLDADLDEMYKEDILIACKELALREPPLGEAAERVSLMLCGPIRGWSRGFLAELAGTFEGIKELFIDRPLRKSTIAHQTTEGFVSISSKLHHFHPNATLTSPDLFSRATVPAAPPPTTPSRVVHVHPVAPMLHRNPPLSDHPLPSHPRDLG